MVVFPLPEIDGGALANIPVDIPWRDPLNFIDFHLLVAGKSILAKAEVRAFFYGREITDELRALSLPLSTLDQNLTAIMSTRPTQVRAALEKHGWIDCSLTADHKCWPLWQSRIQFYWTQHFTAKASLAVEHTYRPVVGGGTIYGNDDGSASIQPYCGGPEALRRIKTQQQLHPAGGANDRPVLVERTIDYILTTAKNWGGPIQRFHLSVIADSPDDIVLTCMPGLTRVGPTRYELVRSNFRPDHDLKLKVLQVAK